MEQEILIEHPELRVGYVTELYYRTKHTRMPKQLDLLYTWYKDLFITVRPSDLTVKEEPEYADKERMIYATRYHSYLYSGGNNRVTQISGRLIGTSSSNREKERLAGEMIQKQTARKLLKETDAFSCWLEEIESLLSLLEEEETAVFHHLLYDFCLLAAENREKLSEFDRDRELYAMEDEVFNLVIYNAMRQLVRYDWDGLISAYAWLLLGSLLRNACGRITRTYDSSFVPLHRISSEEDTLEDMLRYLLFPEQYEQYYTGDDLEKRFPGIEWYCDACRDPLNDQEGFDDRLAFWQCRKCGHINPISEEEIFESEEDWKDGIHHRNRNNMTDAVEERKKERK